MKMFVKYSPNALRDLDEIYDYTVNKILDKADLLADIPYIGTKLFFDNDLFSGYRYIVSGNYLAFYRITADFIFVDRIIYGKRDYMKLLFK